MDSSKIFNHGISCLITFRILWKLSLYNFLNLEDSIMLKHLISLGLILDPSLLQRFLNRWKFRRAQINKTFLCFSKQFKNYFVTSNLVFFLDMWSLLGNEFPTTVVLIMIKLINSLWKTFSITLFLVCA